MLFNIKKKVYIYFFLSLILLILVFSTFQKYKTENVEIVSQQEIEANPTKNKNLDQDEVDNLIKNVKYVTKGINGDEFKIEAETGNISTKDTSIILMKNVKAQIILSNYENIFINSENAEYNINNSNTKFHTSVVTKYLNNVLNSESVEFNFEKNMIYMYNNILINYDDNSKLEANVMVVDVIKKKFEILSEKDDKVKITKKK